MRHRRTILLIVGLAAGGGARSASADEIWQWTHEASGEGWANVFDGGPVRSDSDATKGPHDDEMSFGALDGTRPGTSGGSYGTGGWSLIFSDDTMFHVNVHFDTSYSSSLFGGDLPGGEGEGWLSSVIEFVMPTDQLLWRTIMDVSVRGNFTGSTRVVIENVSQSITLLELESGFLSQSVLSGEIGDLIRITTEMSGSGSAPPDIIALRWYGPSLNLHFEIPEPTGLGLLGFGALVLGGRRRGYGRGMEQGQCEG